MATDHSGAEIFFNMLYHGGPASFSEAGRGTARHGRGSLAHSPLAWMHSCLRRSHRGMTDDGDGFTLAARLHAQNAKAVVFVMKCYNVDEAGEDFRRQVIVCRHRLSWIVVLSPQDLCLSIFFHNRDRPRFNLGTRTFRKGSLAKSHWFRGDQGSILATIANLPHSASAANRSGLWAVVHDICVYRCGYFLVRG